MTTKSSRKATITRRCFIAITVPESVRTQIQRAQSRMKRGGFKASYVRPANIHLTLAFLGDVLLDRIHNAAGAVDAGVLGHAPFSLEAAQLGYFGKRGSPRAIWSHIEGDVDRLRALQADLTEALILNAFPLDGRKFMPHLTMARIRTPKRNVPLVDHLKNDAHQKFGTIPVTQLLLIESILHPEGPEYVVLHASDLRRAESSSD